MKEMEDLEKSLLIVVAIVIIGLGIGANVLTPDKEPVIPELENVFYAVLAGAVIGLLGYMQKTEIPEWETAKFFITLIVSAVAGYVAYTQGMTFTDAFTWLSVIGFDVLVERILKTFIRRLGALER